MNLIIGVSLISLFVVWYYFLPYPRIRRALARHLRVSIKDVQEGAIVTIVGRVKFGDKILQAPFSKDQCCYYHLSVDQYRGETGDIIINETRGIDFYVEDDTGQALVALSRESDIAVIAAARKAQHHSNASAEEEDPAVMAFFASRGIPASEAPNTRLIESTITNDEIVAVIGQGSWEDAPRKGEATGPNGRRCLVFHTTPTIFITTDRELLREAGLILEEDHSRWPFLPMNCQFCGAAIPTRIIDFGALQARCPKCDLISQLPKKK
ncbi:MAG: hypothetical protein JNJ46_20935 [Myxococcales bacterium]|jgi:hypothetical protein|nr:hypothetical protein [Myxococcales bacterium]